MYSQASLQNSGYYKQDGGPLPANYYHDGGNATDPSSSFDKVYRPLPSIPFNGIDPKDIFNNHGFKNRNDLMHNNLERIILDEQIVEYHIQIDSKDRNPIIYPNPFKYTVTFQPLQNTSEVVNGKRIFQETPNPVIYQKLENVRYIVLENAILPIFNHIRENDKINLQEELPDFMYVMLNIAEYQNQTNRFSTNDALSDSFAVIYCDKKINSTHYSTWSNNGIRIFPKDNLVTINKWNISFQDPYGKDLKVYGMHKNCSDTGERCNCEPEDKGDPNDPETWKEEFIDSDCAYHNLRHPMNRLFQHHLQFRVGVVEGRLNKKIFS